MQRLPAADPKSTALLPKDMVLLEHVAEQRENFLSQIEVDSLLCGVSDPAEGEDSINAG